MSENIIELFKKYGIEIIPNPIKFDDTDIKETTEWMVFV